MAAGLGLDATGVDIAPSALDTARHKARQRGRTTRFLRHDARNLADLSESFATVLDCGLFHVFGDGDRATYAGNLRSAVAPCGRYFLLCCSDTLTRTLTRRPGNGETMLTAEAAVDTEHPSRYLVQLCTHASKMGGHVPHRPRSHAGGDEPPEMRHAEWTDTDGIVTLSWGRWTMHATPGTLTLRAEADSEENLLRIQDLVTARLEKFGRRDHLTVNWHRTQAPAAAPGEAG